MSMMSPPQAADAVSPLRSEMRLRHFVLCFEEGTVQFYDPYPEVNGFVDSNILFHTITQPYYPGNPSFSQLLYIFQS